LRSLYTPVLAVDVMICRGREFLLIRRGKPPYRGYWALPGGHVKYGETVEEAAAREAEEETGLKVRLKEIIGVYSKPDRDPRYHVVSIAFLAEVAGGAQTETEEAPELRWFREPPSKMAFDHADIVRDGLMKLEQRL